MQGRESMTARRYVILKHDHPFLHWDLLIEDQDSARTWRLLRCPCLNEPILAQPLSAHRKHYLSYEGPVSANRGTVSRHDFGVVTFASHEGPAGRWGLSGKVFCGMAVIAALPDGRLFLTLTANANRSDELSSSVDQ
jgi:hypothetical protein